MYRMHLAALLADGTLINECRPVVPTFDQGLADVEAAYSEYLQDEMLVYLQVRLEEFETDTVLIAYTYENELVKFNRAKEKLVNAFVIELAGMQTTPVTYGDLKTLAKAKVSEMCVEQIYAELSSRRYSYDYPTGSWGWHFSS